MCHYYIHQPPTDRLRAEDEGQAETEANGEMDMATQDLINKMFDLSGRAAQRRLNEHNDFLSFLEMLVRSAPVDVTAAFGKLTVEVVEDGKTKNFGIILTAPDFMFWKAAIENGARFVSPPATIKRSILDRLSQCIGAMQMTPEEKGEFIDLMKSA